MINETLIRKCKIPPDIEGILLGFLVDSLALGLSATSSDCVLNGVLCRTKASVFSV